MQTSTSELLIKSVRLQKYWSTFPLVLISWQYSYSVVATFTTFIKNPPCLWSDYRPWPISFKPQTCDAVLNTLVNFKGLWNKWKTRGYKRIRDETNTLHHYAHYATHRHTDLHPEGTAPVKPLRTQSRLDGMRPSLITGWAGERLEREWGLPVGLAGFTPLQTSWQTKERSSFM